MTQRFIQVPVWSFEEADEKLREKILEENRYWFVEEDWWKYVYSNWEEKLEELGYLDITINFSHMYSQGAGASFVGAIDSEIIKKRFLNEEELKFLEDCTIYGNVYRITHQYHHYNTISARIPDIDFSDEVDELHENDYDEYCKIRDMADKLLNQIELAVIEDVRNLSKQIYNDLEEEYDALTSNSYISERMLDSDYLFDEHGELAGSKGDEDEQE